MQINHLITCTFIFQTSVIWFREKILKLIHLSVLSMVLNKNFHLNHHNSIYSLQASKYRVWSYITLYWVTDIVVKLVHWPFHWVVGRWSRPWRTVGSSGRCGVRFLSRWRADPPRTPRWRSVGTDNTTTAVVLSSLLRRRNDPIKANNIQFCFLHIWLEKDIDLQLLFFWSVCIPIKSNKSFKNMLPK